jgi:hypothetical protein
MEGRPYELTPDLVRARLRGHGPERIRQYSVEINGVDWPVKQVLRLATGAEVPQSQIPRRLLERLGFTVHGEAMPRSHDSDAAARTSHSAPFDLAALELAEGVDVRVAFSWHRAGQITLDASSAPVFPPLPKLPGLYRFDFGVDSAGTRMLYIGESEELRRRGSNYRNAKRDGGRNRTSRRIHKEIVAHLLAGGAIEFTITTEAHIDGDVAADLRLKSARRLAENAAVLFAQTSPGVRVLNIDADLGEDSEERQEESFATN